MKLWSQIALSTIIFLVIYYFLMLFWPDKSDTIYKYISDCVFGGVVTGSSLYYMEKKKVNKIKFR
jgi:hypothetical protein